MNDLAAFRIYPSTPDSVESLEHAILTKEVHIVLPFARDYDPAGENTTGNFISYFNSTFTPDKIREIKNKSKSNVKFFLSIGGRNAKYPFQIPSDNQEKWVGNAISSLTAIVNRYKFDGIDVYYEHVNSCDEFPKNMGQVLKNLKSGRDPVIKKASLTVSAPLNSLYVNLYKAASAHIDHVVYQSHSEISPVSTVDKLVEVFDGLTNYPNTKIFAGHSILRSDWKKVPLPIFLGALPKLFEKEIVSISNWIVTDHDPEA